MTVVNLYDRIQEYENVTQQRLLNRTPSIISVSCKNVSSDVIDTDEIIFSLDAAAIRLASDVQNCKLVFRHGVEISVLMTDYKLLTTRQWFNGDVQKISSTASSIATAGFAENYYKQEKIARNQTYIFSASTFNIPKEDVIGYFELCKLRCETSFLKRLALKHFSFAEIKHLNAYAIKKLLATVDSIRYDVNACSKTYFRTLNSSRESVRVEWDSSSGLIDKKEISSIINESEVRV